jgi:hypothetical protein
MRKYAAYLAGDFATFCGAANSLMSVTERLWMALEVGEASLPAHRGSSDVYD